ncbi:MAG: response regulator [Holophaga sp.]|jgi:DNA-binding response OmpR family regulator
MARIMIVDDSRLARTFTAACLRKEGHDVLEVDPTSIFDVLKAAKEATPDLLIMDFLMPNCPGTSLARVCHEDPDLRSMRVLVVTAHRDDEVTMRLRNMGVGEVLYKPVEPQTLVEAVRQLLP